MSSAVREKRLRYLRNYHARRKEEDPNYLQDRLHWMRSKRKEDPKWAILQNKKSNAKRAGIEFDIEVYDLDWPTHCPALGVELKYGGGRFDDATASIDRICPNKGYVKGNVQILSAMANRIKTNATAEQVMMVALWLNGDGDEEG